jgi:hypothetical protein
MVRMAHWAVIIPADRYATERLFHHDDLEIPDPGSAGAPGPDDGDEVLVVTAGEKPALVALGRFRPAPAGTLGLAYTRRCFDDPVVADELRLDAVVSRVEPEVFRLIAARLGAGTARRTWLVSLDLPIEAETPAEAVRQFWSYVRELGPAELPTFVSPSDDELAMQAFVLGEQASQDPEEDED